MNKNILILVFVLISGAAFSQGGFPNKATLDGTERVRLFDNVGGNQAVLLSQIGNQVSTIADVATLRLTDGAIGNEVVLTSYYNGLDYGGGSFVYSDTDLFGLGDDNGITFSSNNGGFWIRQAFVENGNEIFVSWFGAVDELDHATAGILCSGDQIQQTFTRAQNGTRVVFDGNKTFVNCRELFPSNNAPASTKSLVIDMAGATLKRIDEITTTLAVPVTAGNNTITVADGSIYREGMSINVVDFTAGGLGLGATFSPNNRTITSIAGNVLTLSGDLGNFPTGATVINSFYHFGFQSDNSAFLNINIDGNSANNTTFNRWESTGGIYSTGDNVLIKNFTSRNGIGEAIFMSGNNLTIDIAKIYDNQGNGIHLGAVNNINIDNIHIVNCNLGQPVFNTDEGVGHNDGGLAFSDNVFDVNISNVTIDNALSFIGGLQIFAGENTFNATNIIGRNLDVVFDGSFFSAADGFGNFTMSNFQFINCTEFLLNNTSGNSDNGYTRWELSNGYLEDTPLRIFYQKDMKISNVRVHLPTLVTSCVYLLGSDNIELDNITTDGGQNGFFLDQTTNCRFRNSDLLNWTNNGFNMTATCFGNVFSNLYINTNSTNAGARGALVRESNEVRSSYFEITGTASSGIELGGRATTNRGGTVRECTIITPAGIRSIFVGGGQLDFVIVNNLWNVAEQNGGTGVVQNNYVITN